MNLSIQAMGKRAEQAALTLSAVPTDVKNRFLETLSEILIKDMSGILKANAADIHEAIPVLSEALVDRLTLNQQRIEGIAADVRNVAALPDPVGEVFESGVNRAGLRYEKVRVPVGVIAVIYESRPNVTVDTACLMIKSGNAAILRGGKETLRTNRAIIEVIRRALEETGLPQDAIQFIDSPDRNLVDQLLHLDEYIDLVIPRGGAGLHDFCRKNSRIPVITGGIGICHLFVDKSADQQKSIPLIENAKVQRPTVCNALETLLVHRDIAAEFLPKLAQQLAQDKVVFHADAQALAILSAASVPNLSVVAADEAADFDKEWLTLDLSVKVVADVKEAIEHIRVHSTGHSDGILTVDAENAGLFKRAVDSACVYVNSSTRFTDGAQLGLGAEIAISTQPLHVRGPMALRELTTYKWLITGDYSVRA
ncbi:MAG: glutamate-5-semialdehyde dehydrogenase [Chloroflexi bacterium]|nr:glutamate-5-semialdehyde dehydrogenase [Chloroflexota bacterium]